MVVILDGWGRGTATFDETPSSPIPSWTTSW